MVDLYCESFKQVPKRITLDIDDTFDAVHGGQQLRLFNAHYDLLVAGFSDCLNLSLGLW
jgi:hypothetical protein